MSRSGTQAARGNGGPCASGQRPGRSSALPIPRPLAGRSLAEGLPHVCGYRATSAAARAAGELLVRGSGRSSSGAWPACRGAGRRSGRSPGSHSRRGRVEHADKRVGTLASEQIPAGSPGVAPHPLQLADRMTGNGRERRSLPGRGRRAGVEARLSGHGPALRIAGWHRPVIRTPRDGRRSTGRRNGPGGR